MGWSCLICMGDLVEALPTEAIYCLLAGGVAYTSSVPFFVRNSNLDHSIWHCFVLAGKMWTFVLFLLPMAVTMKTFHILSLCPSHLAKAPFSTGYVCICMW